MTPKWTEKSVCPKCGGPLFLNMFQKGFRLNCKKCRFKVYPHPGEVSEDLIQRFLRENVAPQIKELQSRLDKWRSSFQHEGG
jgi:ribosomal protein S27AE